MVTGAATSINDFYTALQASLVIEDNPQSSEDGSGLHSPTFMDNENPFDGQSNGFRAPPPDLDIHNVAGLLASHFSTTEPPIAASYHHSQSYPHSDFHYSPYGEPSPPQVYDHERRYPSRSSRGGYGSMRPPSPISYFSGGTTGMSNARPLEIPRPLSIPSLLPTSPRPTESSARSTTEKGLIPQSSRLDSSSQAERASPISPTESLEARPMSGGSGSQAGSVSNSQQLGKREPSLVVIACRQCRARKIRCDSTRPSCNNCVRRQNECHYDSVPKRRGPDKRPGTRQRSCKKRPADGSMPVKKKQKKSSEEPAQSTSPISVSPARTVGGGSGRTSHRVASGAASVDTRSSGLSSPDSGFHPNLGMALTPSPVQLYENAAGTVANVSVNQRSSMPLRLDMNFMNRPVPSHASFGTDQLRSGSLHPLSAPSHPYSSATDSPTTMLSLHTPVPRSAHSPELLLPRSPVHQRGPFSMYEEVPVSAMSDNDATGPMYARQVVFNTIRPSERGIFSFSPSQPVDLTGKLWWDTLVQQYSQTPEQSEAEIMKDITFLFSNSIHWLSFINEQHFRRTLLDPSEREKIQPSLILAALALATLLHSSELEYGQRGRDRALWLRDAAQSLLESAWNQSILDPSLAQAAMLIAIFESSAHPLHSVDRACNSLVFLDQIIRALALTAMDADDPNASVFRPEAVPIVPRPFVHDLTVEERCYCAPPVHSPQLDIGSDGRISPNWSSSISWDPNWTTEEIEREETRRLCWAALSLAAAHTTHCAAFHTEPLDLFISRPENYALFFPGEKGAANNEIRGPNYSPKQSLWALYCRSMLLWNSCLNLRKNANDTDKAEFAMNAWLETQDIQDGLESHRCETESHLVHMTKEHLFNTRIAVSYEFRRLQDLDTGSAPRFNRRQAQEWLYYQSITAKRFEHILHDAQNPQSKMLARRPFYVWWFMSQLHISMSLWIYDNTLVQALNLCKSFLVTLDILSALWPCQSQRDRYLSLREELTVNCEKAGLSPPPPPDFSLPLSLRP